MDQISSDEIQIKSDSSNHRGRFTLDALLVLVGSFSAQSLVAVAAAYTARESGPRLFGLLAVAMALVAIIADLGDCGTSTWVCRGVSRGQVDRHAAAVFLLRRSWVFLMASIAWTTIWFALGNRQIYTLFILPVYVVALPLVIATTQLLRATFQFKKSLFYTTCDRLVLVVTCLICTKLQLDPVMSFALGLTLGTATNLGLSMGTLLADPPVSRGAFIRLSDTYRASISLGISGLTSDLNLLEVPLVGAVGGGLAAGQFGASSRLVGPLGLPLGSLSQALTPHILQKAGSPRDALMIIVSQWKIVAIALLSLTAVGVFSPQIVSLTLGAAYGTPTVDCLRVTCIGVALSGLSQLMIAFLQSQNLERSYARILVVAVALGLIGTGLGATRGPAMAASGNLLAQVVLFGSLIALCRSRLKNVNLHRRNAPGDNIDDAELSL